MCGQVQVWDLLARKAGSASGLYLPQEVIQERGSPSECGSQPSSGHVVSFAFSHSPVSPCTAKALPFLRGVEQDCICTCCWLSVLQWVETEKLMGSVRVHWHLPGEAGGLAESQAGGLENLPIS